ncbi:MAG: hypothetical protein WD044_03795 [Dongiaceae bacterium]
MITYLWAPSAGAKGENSFGPLLEEGVRDGRIAIVPFAEALAGRAIAPGAVIFSDVPRLLGPVLVKSAGLWDRLTAAGARPLNHPARALRRFALLRRLKAEGLNGFDIWRGDERRDPMRYPLFVRGINDRDGPYGGLIRDRHQLDAAIESWIAMGRDPEHLLIIEFCNTASPDRLYRRYTAYVVGERIFHWRMHFGREWIVREPRIEELASEHDVDALIAEERTFAAGEQHVEALRHVAALAHLELGRIDYAIENGRIVVWEINWSPLAHEPPPPADDPQIDWFMADRWPVLRAAVDALDPRS